MQPEIEYGAWNPVSDHSSEIKMNRVRSIPSSPPERQFVPNSQNKNRQSNARGDAVKNLNRRNFESPSINDQNFEKRPDVSTLRPAYKRRVFSTSSTISTPASTVKIVESNAGRFKNFRKTSSDVITARRPFTPRSTSENILSAASESPLTTKSSAVKKAPVTRGNFRPKPAGNEATKDDGDENYPEHFKQLLKTKEVNTQQNDKSVIKKPIKTFRPTSTSARPLLAGGLPSSVKPKSNVLFPTRQNRFLSKPSTVSTVSTEPSTSSSQSVTIAPKRLLRTRTRPTERTRVKIGSTLQEPPTVKHSTPIYATKSPLAQESETYEERIITQGDGLRQIDPPISEYLPRTKSVSALSFLKL